MLHLYFYIGIIGGLINALLICIFKIMGLYDNKTAVYGLIFDVSLMIFLWPVTIIWKIVIFIYYVKNN